ncbi:MAG: tetratricopeptide repeat protein, partial [Candidatus Spechtbacteria bacterium]|nr:tetratricopeptide repeat protein [Candidatus Spechtbacteria bacterium]
SVLQYKDQERARHYLTLAKDTLKKAVAMSPTNQNGYLSLAQTYIFEKDFKKAEELLKHAIDLEPRYADSHWNLGEAYMIAENFEKSAKEYDTALALGYNPSSDIRKLANLGHSYSEAREYEKAVFWYKKVVEVRPNNPESHWTLATFYKALGEYEKAKEEAMIVKSLDAQYAGTVEDFLKHLTKSYH